ncbi:MAG: nitroreductase family protein [Spirochaetaceae bacterium]|jgi:nitroreductase|nr:nitroreductase family protein [Spirochaetaceae bacterium]
MKKRSDLSIMKAIDQRWSPCGFLSREISTEDLEKIFEAARWAPSAFNEQPWRYVIAQRQHSQEFQKALSCLSEYNQGWAKFASVLVFGIASTTFKQNGKDNQAAMHDLGLADSHIMLQASEMGIHSHPMTGILAERIEQEYSIPQGYQAKIAIALGYYGYEDELPDIYRERDENPPVRQELSSFLFQGEWGKEWS